MNTSEPSERALAVSRVHLICLVAVVALAVMGWLYTSWAEASCRIVCDFSKEKVGKRGCCVPIKKRRKAKRKRTGTMVVDVTDVGRAVVCLDGTYQGVTPWQQRSLRPGKYRLVVRVTGDYWRADAVVTAGKTTRYSIEELQGGTLPADEEQRRALCSQPLKRALITSKLPASVALDVVEIARIPLLDRPPDAEPCCETPLPPLARPLSSSPSPRPWWRTSSLVTAGVVGVGSTVAGAVFGLQAQEQYTLAVKSCDDHFVCDRAGYDAGLRARKLGAWANISFALSGLAAVAGGVIWLSSRRAAGRKITVAPEISGSSTRLEVIVSF